MDERDYIGRHYGAHASVNDDDRYPTFLSSQEKIRPQFAFPQNNERRRQTVENAADGPGEIERPDKDAQIGKMFACLF
jgi:hypothetical protein